MIEFKIMNKDLFLGCRKDNNKPQTSVEQDE